MPACNAFCLLLYFLTTMFEAEKPKATAPMWAAFWFGFTCLFRYSLLPFLGLGVALVFWQNRRRFRPSHYLWSVGIFTATLMPTLMFNFVRMGSWLKPATMSPQFAAQNGLTADVLSGAVGLLISPNRGLFVFSPMLLLLFTLPWCWKTFPAAIRSTTVCLAPGTFLYFLMISGLRNWGAAGWGPRYLLPVLPLLFLGAGFALAILWKRHRTWRAISLISVILAGSVAVPAILVNYTAAMKSDPAAIDTQARAPRQILDTIEALISGLQGRSAATGELRAQEATVMFPDLAVTRVILMVSKKSHGAAIGVLAVYLLALTAILYGLTRRNGSDRR